MFWFLDVSDHDQWGMFRYNRWRFSVRCFAVPVVSCSHSPTGAPAPAKPQPFFIPPAKRLQRPGGVRRGLPIFTREGAMQEQW